MLIYRVFRNERKRKLKLAHASVNLACLVLSVVGLRAVFAFHGASDINDMYSLHSWLGLVAVTLFAFQVRCTKSVCGPINIYVYLKKKFLSPAQWVCGLVSFLFPGLASHLRALYLPIHVFLGVLIFILACATALIGITEKAIFSM